MVSQRGIVSGPEEDPTVGIGLGSYSRLMRSQGGFGLPEMQGLLEDVKSNC